MLKRSQLKEQVVIKAMTRIPSIGGISYSYWAMMLLISTSGIVVVKSFFWFFGLLAVFYIVGRFIARHDIFLMDIVITKLSECPSNPNDGYWGCKSYEPW